MRKSSRKRISTSCTKHIEPVGWTQVHDDDWCKSDSCWWQLFENQNHEKCIKDHPRENHTELERSLWHQVHEVEWEETGIHNCERNEWCLLWRPCSELWTDNTTLHQTFLRGIGWMTNNFFITVNRYWSWWTWKYNAKFF